MIYAYQSAGFLYGKTISSLSKDKHKLLQFLYLLVLVWFCMFVKIYKYYINFCQDSNLGRNAVYTKEGLSLSGSVLALKEQVCPKFQFRGS